MIVAIVVVFDLTKNWKMRIESNRIELRYIEVVQTN